MKGWPWKIGSDMTRWRKYQRMDFTFENNKYQFSFFDAVCLDHNFSAKKNGHKEKKKRRNQPRLVCCCSSFSFSLSFSHSYYYNFLVSIENSRIKKEKLFWRFLLVALFSHSSSYICFDPLGVPSEYFDCMRGRGKEEEKTGSRTRRRKEIRSDWHWD